EALPCGVLGLAAQVDQMHEPGAGVVERERRLVLLRGGERRSVTASSNRVVLVSASMVQSPPVNPRVRERARDRRVPPGVVPRPGPKPRRDGHDEEQTSWGNETARRLRAAGSRGAGLDGGKPPRAEPNPPDSRPRLRTRDPDAHAPAGPRLGRA